MSKKKYRISHTTHVSKTPSDPARVLHEVEAKRRILALCQEAHTNAWTADIEPWAHEVILELAMPYSGHPDYREEWSL